MAFTRIVDTLGINSPLKKQTGAEVARSVVIDYNTVTADGYGRKLVVEGELLCKITATGKFGPYSRTATDGRAVISRLVSVVANERADVRQGDSAIGGWYHACIFDKSHCTLHFGTKQTGLTTLRAAFPTCEWDD